MPDTVGSDQHKPTSLRGIANRAKACKHHRFRDLYRNLNAEFLLSCWGNLNKAAASGVDEVTAQAYQENLEANIQALAERLKMKRYRTKLVRRCYIPKENGKQRPLGVPFLNLIRKWLKAGILDTDGRVIHPGAGTPQGGIVSPILANVYLHYALNLWVEHVVKTHCQGEALICLYADDFVCAFRYRDDAERFFRALPTRLGKFGLEVAPEKTRLMRFSRFHPSMERRFSFLGYELYWFEDRKGIPRVMRRTSRRKLQAACKWIKEWVKLNRHLPGQEFIAGLNRRLLGHYNYYGLRGNSRPLWRFYQWAIECSFKWLDRRGGKRRSFTWKAFTQALKRLGVERPPLRAMESEARASSPR